MSSRLALFIDLGDVFTKCIALGETLRERVRFPSAVASRLMSGGPEMTELLLDRASSLPRLPSFDASAFPRTRSFPGSAELVRHVRARPAASSARFAGRIAAIYGADRRFLGQAPSAAVVDALVHKALILSAVDERCEADVTFVVDAGKKAAIVSRYAARPHAASVELRSYSDERPRRLALELRARVVDAPDCIRAALPPELAPSVVGALLVVDIGHFRTKLAVLSAEGCVYRHEVQDLGSFEVVRRILRDGQEQGLVEDEFAVIQALENAVSGSIAVAGRRFAIDAPLRSALALMTEELTRVTKAAILEHYRRAGQACRALVIVGGGAVLAGPGFEASMRSAELGLDVVWRAREPSFVLVEGARALGLGA